MFDDSWALDYGEKDWVSLMLACLFGIVEGWFVSKRGGYFPTISEKRVSVDSVRLVWALSSCSMYFLAMEFMDSPVDLYLFSLLETVDLKPPV